MPTFQAGHGLTPSAREPVNSVRNQAQLLEAERRFGLLERTAAAEDLEAVALIGDEVIPKVASE